MYVLKILFNEAFVFIGLASIQPHDGVQVFQLPLAPLVESAVHHGVIVPGVDKQHLVEQFFPLALVKKPKGAWQTLGVEKVVAHADHDINVSGLHKFLTDVLILALAVRSRGSHNEACPAMFIQVCVEIGYPEIVCVAYLLVFIHSG